MSKRSVSHMALNNLIRAYDKLSSSAGYFSSLGMEESAGVVGEAALRVYQICHELRSVFPDCLHPDLSRFKDPLVDYYPITKEKSFAKDFLFGDVYNVSSIPPDYEFNPNPTCSYLLHDVSNSRYYFVTELSGKFIHLCLNKRTFWYFAFNTDIIAYMINHKEIVHNESISPDFSLIDKTKVESVDDNYDLPF